MALFGNKTSLDATLLQTTSKDALKRSALMICGGDVKAASEVCEYFMKDMPNMPDYDPQGVSVLTQTKDTVLGVSDGVLADKRCNVGKAYQITTDVTVNAVYA